MVHWAWIIVASVVSGSLGFLIAALCSAAHNGDHPQELWQAFRDGYDAGQDKPGCSLAGLAEWQKVG